VFDPTLEFEFWRIDGARSLEFDTVRWCRNGGPRAVGEPVERERTRVSGALVEMGGTRPCPRRLPEGLPWAELPPVESVRPRCCAPGTEWFCPLPVEELTELEELAASGRA